ncbi:MAG: hypothetical protein DWQ19_11875 [Crenarchaeota archaeon]|nr:MAG: hypothetical protein DWQ19_11875 [Thermoproteota archaeon]
MAARRKINPVRCKLPPYEVEEVLTLEEAQQKAGWNITAFNLPEAWSVTQGEGVKIAVLDSGCDLDHPDLVENLLPGKNFVNPRQPPEDDNQHGCVSPDCLVHTNFCGIETIETLFQRLNCSIKHVQQGNHQYQIKDLRNMGIKTYSFDSQTQKTIIGEIEAIHKLPINGDIVEVELEGNISYKLTPWHPVYTIKNRHHKVYDIIRKRADKVEKGDLFVFPRGELAGQLVKEHFRLRYHQGFICENCGHMPKYYLNDMPSKCKKCKKQNWQHCHKEILVDEDLAYLVGIVLTDGHLSKDRVEVHSSTLQILERIKTICAKKGWNSVMDKNRVLIYGKDCIQILTQLGLLKKHKSLKQSLPEFVGKSPYEVVCAFIAGTIDGDGCISPSNTQNRITTSSKKFAEQICMLFNSVGIYSSVSKPSFDKRKNRKIISKNAIYNVIFSNISNDIGQKLSHPIKIARSKKIPKYNRKGRRVKSVKTIKYNGFFYDFTIKDHHNYLGNGHYISNTHVAGILAASNNSIGMVGVAPESKIVPVKVLNAKGGGTLDVVAKGLIWAVNDGADIVVMSLGSPRPLAQVRKAIQYAESKGVPVFVAAGNAVQWNAAQKQYVYTKELFYPANYPETIAVGSIDENFDRSSFSNTGENLDFLAPGGQIFSTVPDNWYAILSGTSMATPFAAGVAALCLSYQRKHFPNKPLKGAEAYRKLFRQNVMALPDKVKANKFFSGFGIIDTRDLKKWIASAG